METVRSTNTTGHTLVVFGIHTGYTLWNLGIYMRYLKTIKKKRNEILAIPGRIHATSCKMRESGEEPQGNEGRGN